MTRTRLLLPGCVVAAALAFAGCTGAGEGGERSPGEVLAAAKARLDRTSGVHVTLETDELPPSVSGVLSATGVGTRDPAFEGELRVATGGVAADVAVVAADGRVFARLPFTTEYVEVDPADYGARDPADLMDPDTGLSSLLTAAEGVEQAEPVRRGEDVLSSYTATVPGDAVAGIIPSADPRADFAARFGIDEEDRLREAVLTGPFYPGVAKVSYTVAFDRYDTTADITLP